MNASGRRRFFKELLSLASVAAVAPFALARAGDAAQFAAGLKRQPWLEGWRNVSAEALGPSVASVRGRLPAALAGTLYRNGPAWFERAGFRYEHWFDGDGMVHAWRLGADGIRHASRMVATPKFERERKAGRFVMAAPGTHVPNQRAARNNDDVNSANTSVMVLGGKPFALCEAGSAFELAPETLETVGPKVWREDLAAVPFSAHPRRDADGTIWNFGAINLVGGAGLLIWHLGADGRLLTTKTLECPAVGYIHSFSMTSQYLLFALTPCRMGESGPFFERMTFQPNQPLRIAVVRKDDLSDVRWFEADFAMVYHFADASERDGEILLRAVRHPDLAEARSPIREAVVGLDRVAHEPEALSALRLDLRSGRARWQHYGIRAIEFPMFDERTPADTPAIMYAPAVLGGAPSFNAVLAIDAERGKVRTHRYDDGILAEQHVFVPRPGSHRPNDGWLVGTLLDTGRRRSGLAILDAGRVDAGPLAEAWLDYDFPLGFHGTFSQR